MKHPPQPGGAAPDTPSNTTNPGTPNKPQPTREVNLTRSSPGTIVRISNSNVASKLLMTAWLVLLVMAIFSAVVLAQPSNLKHEHKEYVTITQASEHLVKILLWIIGVIIGHSVLILASAIYVGRRLQRTDHHSDEIKAHTVELARLAAGQQKLLEMVAELRGVLLAGRSNK